MEEKVVEEKVLLYQERLLDYYRHPRHKGALEKPSFSTNQLNPSCGDSIKIDVQVAQGVITDMCFTGAGCAVSQAAASMLSEYCRGKKLTEVVELDANFMRSLVGIELGPIRIKCAILSLQALQEGAKTYKQKSEQKSE